MNVEEEVRQLSGLLKVGAVASMCGVTVETLRNWDKTGKLVAKRHPLTGYRFYERDDVKKFIQQRLRERGLIHREGIHENFDDSSGDIGSVGTSDTSSTRV
ncbi:helix-turn-helix domain-containing protein [Rubripirellula reticaptiva]|uniref:Zinc-responsive transcriptional regulator n=1 Tax=Rubripirellula reticaptiva TaxID=2528013 RepID=A0A5C6EQ57_9BACT|nr:MerR family DNA-binding transcriptional regulator [Rubripirellula reticaptiva]TWU49519.1 zinc-responsive transcriptional regulator [Rubripirellula reticaptiva]